MTFPAPLTEHLGVRVHDGVIAELRRIAAVRNLTLPHLLRDVISDFINANSAPEPSRRRARAAR